MSFPSDGTVPDAHILRFSKPPRSPVERAPWRSTSAVILVRRVRRPKLDCCSRARPQSLMRGNAHLVTRSSITAFVGNRLRGHHAGTISVERALSRSGLWFDGRCCRFPQLALAKGTGQGHLPVRYEDLAASEPVGIKPSEISYRTGNIENCH